MKRMIIATVLNMFFLSLAFLTWLASPYLVDKTGWSYELFKFIAICIGFCGFLSICIIGEKSVKDGRGTDTH